MPKFIKRKDHERRREGEAARPRPSTPARPGEDEGRADADSEPRRPGASSGNAHRPEGNGRRPDDGDVNGSRHNGDHGNNTGHAQRPRISGAKAIAHAKEYLFELTGQEPESVSGLSAAGARWKVALDIVELERVPRTTDVMASYELEIDEDGQLVGYRRVGRYYRSQVDQG
jgi:hypothetical protein